MRSRENRLQEMRSVRILVLLIKMLHDFMSYKPLWNTDMPMEDRDQKIKFRKVTLYNLRNGAGNTVTVLKVFDERDCREIIG